MPYQMPNKNSSVNKMPNILAISGLDPSGGAGLIADIKTISALNGFGTGVVTCLTTQNTQSVLALNSVKPQIIQQQLRHLFSDVKIDAVKIGVMCNASIIDVVAEELSVYPSIPIVLDTVIEASSNNSSFLDRQSLDVLCEKLAPLARVITPNLSEAVRIIKKNMPLTKEEMRNMARELYDFFFLTTGKLIYLKGGHLESDSCPDVLFDGVKFVSLEKKRINIGKTHGTGCTLSSAIATLIPQSPTVFEACRLAKEYVFGAIKAADSLSAGNGAKSLNHFHV